MPGWAIRHSAISITSCERCARSPATPSSRHRELHPGAPAQARGPAGVFGALVAREGLDDDLAVEPGQPLELLADDRGLERPLGGQGRVLPVAAAAAARAARAGTARSTRSGDGVRISTASARARREVTSVTRASTVSPGSACRTNTTGPSCGRATHQPPWATSTVVSSPPGPVGGNWHGLGSRFSAGDRRLRDRTALQRGITLPPLDQAVQCRPLVGRTPSWGIPWARRPDQGTRSPLEERSCTS